MLALRWQVGRESEAAAEMAASLPAAEWAAVVSLASAVLVEQERRQGGHSLLVLPAAQMDRVLADLRLPGR